MLKPLNQEDIEGLFPILNDEKHLFYTDRSSRGEIVSILIDKESSINIDDHTIDNLIFNGNRDYLYYSIGDWFLNYWHAWAYAQGFEK